MYELFKNVSEQNFNGKVTVIDSRSVSAYMIAQVFMIVTTLIVYPRVLVRVKALQLNALKMN